MHKHEIDMEKAVFKPGVGWVGPCKVCGVKVFHQNRTVVAPSYKEHMSKKERLRLRHESPIKKIGHREDIQ